MVSQDMMLAMLTGQAEDEFDAKDKLLHALLKIAQELDLSKAQLATILDFSLKVLSDPDHSGMNFTAEQLQRVSYLISIHKALHARYSNPKHMQQWLSKPHEQFSGDTALTVILTEPLTGIATVAGVLTAK